MSAPIIGVPVGGEDTLAPGDSVPLVSIVLAALAGALAVACAFLVKTDGQCLKLLVHWLLTVWWTTPLARFHHSRGWRGTVATSPVARSSRDRYSMPRRVQFEQALSRLALLTAHAETIVTELAFLSPKGIPLFIAIRIVWPVRIL